jgi:transposase
MREQVLTFMTNVPKCLVGMEACGGASYWARELTKLGHTVKLIAPQFVKPYVKTNKNDQADSEAICEAVARPNMRFVPIKTVEQQDILFIHRVRQRLVKIYYSSNLMLKKDLVSHPTHNPGQFKNSGKVQNAISETTTWSKQSTFIRLLRRY